MANRNNKKCICCSKSYEFCTGCAKDNEKPSWMNIYCSENCRNLFQGATDYRAGEITKDQAKKIVENADLTNEKNFRDSIKKFIKEIQEAYEVEKLVEKEEIKKEIKLIEFASKNTKVESDNIDNKEDTKHVKASLYNQKFKK